MGASCRTVIDKSQIIYLCILKTPCNKFHYKTGQKFIKTFCLKGWLQPRLHPSANLAVSGDVCPNWNWMEDGLGYQKSLKLTPSRRDASGSILVSTFYYVYSRSLVYGKPLRLPNSDTRGKKRFWIAFQFVQGFSNWLTTYLLICNYWGEGVKKLTPSIFDPPTIGHRLRTFPLYIFIKMYLTL